MWRGVRERRIIISLYSLFHKKKTEKFLSENRDVSRAELEAFYNNTASKYGVKMDSRLLLYEAAGGGFEILKIREICWAHRRDTKIKYWGLIPMGTVRRIVLYTTKNQILEIQIGATENQGKEGMAYFYPYLKHAVFGYSPQLQKLWNSELNLHNGHPSLLELGQKQHQQNPTPQF